ncbi:MAG: HTH-type transcriptional regulator MurR [Firmicutes bacterium ADurb.Bin182]|nr:MAG: HTH-type transcriptional regulator MurR [Firmicutes bacterium ADurb.Bin182]
MSSIDLLAKLNQDYKKLSKGQKKIATYILENYDKAAFVTASKMGHAVGVSESTVVRFAYSLGFNGYPEMQRALQELIRNRLTTAQRIQLTSEIESNDILKSVLKADINNLRSTMESIDYNAFSLAAEAILNAEHVYIIGLRSSYPLSLFFSYYLSNIIENVKTVSVEMREVDEQLFNIGENDLCIGISFIRYSKRTAEGMMYAKSKGAHLVAITDSRSSPIAEISDCSLVAKCDMVSFPDSLVAPLSLINALIAAVGMRKKEMISNRFEQLEGIWGIKQVYMTPGAAADIQK